MLPYVVVFKGQVKLRLLAYTELWTGLAATNPFELLGNRVKSLDHVKSAVTDIGSVLNSISKGFRFEPRQRHRAVSLSTTLYPLLSTASI